MNVRTSDSWKSGETQIVLSVRWRVWEMSMTTMCKSASAKKQISLDLVLTVEELEKELETVKDEHACEFTCKIFASRPF